MKAFIFDLIYKLKRASDTLDARAVLCNKTWRAFSDSGEKEVYIFMEDGTLIISINGNVTMGKWMYLPANHSLVVSGNNMNLLVHPVMCNNILTLVQDGTNNCFFLLDATKAELDIIKTLQNVQDYILTNANINQYILNDHIQITPTECNKNVPEYINNYQTQDISYIFDDNGAEYEPDHEIRVDDPNLLYRWSNHTFYYKIGAKYVKLHGEIVERDGKEIAILSVSDSHDYDRMTLWLRDNDNVTARISLRCSNLTFLPHPNNSCMSIQGNEVTQEILERIILPRFEFVKKKVLSFKRYDG